MGEDPNAKKKEDKEEQSKSRKQIEESRQVSLMGCRATPGFAC